ncbi:alpha/beta hydrolase family protein [Catenuloplanes japonicus]|uniref:alpha/beta hydrolase n=1 Tax=Catenuloplanes japonicus TaxID=33876 RepID=UPI000525CA7D|nr:alpha/beta hydrolase [Catenuloplanes japonicus]
MRFTSTDGITEQEFLLDDVPAVLWTPDDGKKLADRPLIVNAHGGGQHKKAPSMLAAARRFVLDGGFAVLAMDAPAHNGRPRTEAHEQAIARIREPGGVAALHKLLSDQSIPEWRAVLDALDPGPIGYFGLSMGSGLGIPFVAREPRVRAAVLGLLGHESADAALISVPTRFLMQWDDELVSRDAALELFDSIGSQEKALHANPGGHGEVPEAEWADAVRFFTRHLR